MLFLCISKLWNDYLQYSLSTIIHVQINSLDYFDNFSFVFLLIRLAKRTSADNICDKMWLIRLLSKLDDHLLCSFEFINLIKLNSRLTK